MNIKCLQKAPYGAVVIIECNLKCEILKTRDLHLKCNHQTVTRLSVGRNDDRLNVAFMLFNKTRNI